MLPCLSLRGVEEDVPSLVPTEGLDGVPQLVAAQHPQLPVSDGDLPLGAEGQQAPVSTPEETLDAGEAETVEPPLLSDIVQGEAASTLEDNTVGLSYNFPQYSD